MTENNHSDNNNYPKIIPLISLNEKRQWAKVPRVLDFHVSNRLTNPEYFYHQMIIILISQWKRTFKWVSTNILSDVQWSPCLGNNNKKLKGNWVIWEFCREHTWVIAESLELNNNVLDKQENTEHWFIKVSQHRTRLLQNWYCVT